MAKDEVSDVYGVNSFNADHPRKIFIRDLPRIYSEIEVEERKGGLERVFRKYGGDRGVTVIAPTNATYAFIEMESESMTDLALREMGNMYGMNRARWTRHEALKEKRAAAQAVAGGGVERKGGTWD